MAGAGGRIGVCVGRLQRGAGDPTHRRVGQVFLRASRTPHGPVLLELVDVGDDVQVTAWGQGSDWALEQAPRLLGCHDPADFVTDHPLLSVLWRRNPRLRVGATDLVCETLLPTVVEQRVTGAEAFRAIRLLTRRFSDPAPGPAQVDGHPAHGMMLPLSAEQWAQIPSWDYLRAGVEQTRSKALVGAARRARALERTLTLPDAHRGLVSPPGIGDWTSARTRQMAHGDPDAWSIGDYHVPGAISSALAGQKLDDAATLALLEPFVGHRYRVEQLVMVGVGLPERHGPRKPLPTHLP